MYCGIQFMPSESTHEPFTAPITSKIPVTVAKSNHDSAPFLPTTINFENRPEWSTVYTLYKHLLRALGAVHEVGRVKYSEFGWMTDPKAPNASTLESVDALIRHTVSLRSRCVTDTEGFPHLYHIACRSGMLLSKYYAEVLYRRAWTPHRCTVKHILSSESLLPLAGHHTDGKRSKDTLIDIFLVHVTTEEYFSMLKVARLQKDSGYINALRMKCQDIQKSDNHPEAVTDYLLDLLLLYLRQFLEEYTATDYMNNEHHFLSQKEWDTSINQMWTVDYLFVVVALLLEYIELHPTDYFAQWRMSDRDILSVLQKRHDDYHVNKYQPR